MKMDKEFLRKIEIWMDIKDAMKTVKAKELELRLEICTKLLKDGNYDNVLVIDGEDVRIKAKSKINTSVDIDQYNNKWNMLTQGERMCVAQKHVPVMKCINALPKDSIAWKFIVTNPGTPTLDFEVV